MYGLASVPSPSPRVRNVGSAHAVCAVIVSKKYTKGTVLPPEGRSVARNLFVYFGSIAAARENLLVTKFTVVMLLLIWF